MRVLKKELCFFTHFQKFIRDSETGKRLQPNGKRLGQGTVKNYIATQKLLRQFCTAKNFRLRIRQERHMNARETKTENIYWKRFYRQFLDFLYNDCGFYDNYTGQNIKIIKVFFNYLNKDIALGIGSFHKQFYVPKEEISIFPLMPEELHYLIYNQEFERSLTPRMQQVKDVFVFGCTVALRVSDLLALKKTNLRVYPNAHYLSVRSIKTNTESLIKLPDYAIAILLKYQKSKTRLLPHFNKSNLNEYLKLLLEKGGFVRELDISRERKGKTTLRRKHSHDKRQGYRFCDVASTHIMRRTAITTMLCLGMPEPLVRKISGHTPQSKDFYRYCLWAQTYQDREAEAMFAKLKQMQITTDPIYTDTKK